MERTKTQPFEIEISSVKADIIQDNTLYGSEKIPPQKKSQTHEEPYATFARMRKIGRTDYNTYNSNYYGRTSYNGFVKQAEYMKDFIDYYDIKKPLQSYYTTYDDMDDIQLRTYFAWRAKVRQGNTEDISLSYAFCYIYELINNIGVSDAKDGIDKLINFWTGFRVYNTKIDSYMRRWIKDYYIVHYIESMDSFETISRYYPIPYKIKKNIINSEQGKWDIKIFELNSKYKLSKMTFYKNGNTKVIDECLSAILKAINNLFNQNNLNFMDLFMMSIYKSEEHYTPFSSAVYIKQNTENKIVKLSEHEIYICENGQWSVQKYNYKYSEFPYAKGYILKIIEIQMRKKFGGRQNLKTPKTIELFNEFRGHRDSWRGIKKWKKQVFELIINKDFEQTIINAIQDYCKAKNLVIKDGKIIEVKPVEIDLSRLDKIKEEHEETATRLIVEELPTETPEPVHNETIKSILVIPSSDGFIQSLTKDEKDLLLLLIESRQSCINCEILVASINEKAISVINDNVIYYRNEVPYIHEEYLEKLRTLIGEN